MNEGSSTILRRSGDGGDSDEWQSRYFESASADTLHSRPAAALAGCAAGHRVRAGVRSPEEILVWVSPGEASGITVVETCVEDMPFLVDTVVMVLREKGAAVDWIVHPVLRVRRDAQGRLEGLADADQGTAESWIHAEIEHSTADSAALRSVLLERLSALRVAVGDYAAMHARLLSVCTTLRTTPRGCAADEIAEAREFLRWLDADHFSFLGVSEARARHTNEGRTLLVPVPAAGLGLAREGQALADVDALIAPREELEKYADSPRVLVVIKAGLRASIHSPDFMDVVTVKLFTAEGSVSGSVRFIGLFSSEAYEERPWAIPLIRRKVELVMQRSGLDPESHSGKNLREILGSFPRDELFQSGEDELLRTCLGIRELRERQQLRLFLRRDRYGRFFSALLYLPRDRYSRELRERVAHELSTVLAGLSVDRNVEFLRGGLARIHYLVRTAPGTQLTQSAEEIELRLQQLTRPWRDQLRAALVATGRSDDAELTGRFGDAFAPAYIERMGIAEVAADTVQLAALGPQCRIRPRLDAAAQRLKLYMSGEPLALSDVLPVLENFGLRVIRQDPEPVNPSGGEAALWIQDFQVALPPQADGRAAASFEQGLVEVLTGQAEDDALNALVLAAGLRVRQVVCLRTLARYVNQVGLPFGRADIDRAVAAHPRVARLAAALFEARFDPQLPESRRRDAEIAAAQGLDEALDQVTSLDADRILRVLVSAVRAGLRTNFFQPDADQRPKSWVSLKLDPSRVLELPRPLPMFEVWVCSPEVEGIHLRGGRVARGGLRWSDRREDFRTEVLGLMKAQQVKNAVIVPVGAKGGFVVKKGPPPTEREAWMANGIACYRSFLRGLLDLTDNLVNDVVVPPPAVVRHDGDDPYLVVAADKGTATFSDIANGVAADYDFWLGDAFASGGSAGYDHKKMGITARGAWKSVQRHFREIGLDIQTQAFTVVGIGDMSGDVFGNGMLLSPQIRLLAAFDHRHIFIDPNPDAAASFAERERLFGLPRSSWADYDASLISEGGGVFARGAKLIRVSPQAAQALGCEPRGMTPNELIRAILRAPADLLWNGGIGTYVKASTQGHDQVRDRSNDAVRVNGRELRARVVGEGGNLGLTQAGRIEYARRGGRLNTDAIDNSGGVHSSDREVNIKIPLNPLLRQNRITRAERDSLLASMTDEVAAFVLRDNEVQSGCISLMEVQAAERLDEHAALMRHLEREGVLDRALENLPDDEGLQERRAERQGLTRPELAVLVAYAKITLFDAALSSDMPDDPFFVPVLLGNFPKALVAAHREALVRHRLRREIIATILANAVVNRMGVSFAHRLAEDQGVPRAEVLKAYAAAHELFAGDGYWTAIECLDGQLPARLQYRLMHMAVALLKHVTGWLIRMRLTERLSVGQIVDRYAATVPEIERLLPQVLPGSYREDYERVLAGLHADQVPENIAQRLTRTKALGSALDVFDLAEETGIALEPAARTYFDLGEKLRMPWMLGAIVQLGVASQWQALARSKLRDDAYRLHRLLAGHVIRAGGVEAWSAANERRLKFSLGRLAELQASGAVDYAGLAVAVRELYALQLG